MNVETLYEVVKRINGSIKAVGDFYIDEERRFNLERQCNLTRMLLKDIVEESKNKDSYQGSVNSSGKYAYNFIEGLYEYLRDEVEEDEC